jgi:hypothetical protein
MVVLTSAVSFLVPEGKLNKLINKIFSLMIILVVLTPLTKIFNNTNFTFLDGIKQIEIQSEYLYYVSLEKMTSLEKNCQEIIEKEGVKDATVSINYNVSELGQVFVNSIVIDCKVALSQTKKTLVEDKLIEFLSEYVKLNDGVIVFSGAK